METLPCLRETLWDMLSLYNVPFTNNKDFAGYSLVSVISLVLVTKENQKKVSAEGTVCPVSICTDCLPHWRWNQKGLGNKDHIYKGVWLVVPSYVTPIDIVGISQTLLKKCLGHLISAPRHLSLSLFLKVNIFKNLAPPFIFKVTEDQVVHCSCQLSC